MSDRSDSVSGSSSAALILAVPAADPVIESYRMRWDQSARNGLPAHITVGYPFKPMPLTDDDVEVLRRVMALAPRFVLRFEELGRFGDEVLFLDPVAPAEIISLTRRIEEAFPDYPIYGGVFDELHPHVTVAYGCGAAAMRSMEAGIRPRLPLVQGVAEVQLWARPTDEAGNASWQFVHGFSLGRLTDPC